MTKHLNNMNISQFFDEHNKVAIAFSGGVDSAYLLYEAVQHGADAMAYYVKSQFQPQFEYEDALRLTKDVGAKLKVIDVDVLSCETVVKNDPLRCYYCKQIIFENIIRNAKMDGYQVILDGTNASDDASDRPGMKALTELKVLSPLRICGLTKEKIREQSKKAGLFTHDKPAYACLATRVKTGECIDEDKLVKVEAMEKFLMELGFSDLRVRVSLDTATIQVRREQFDLFYEHEEEIRRMINNYYDIIEFDEKGR